jgi:16S rRNA (uracil1498-N3)-methyltransferase
MTSPPWFYCPFDELETDSLELFGEEANHILGARRMHLGDELILSNGQGQLAHCTLIQVNKKTRVLELRVSLIAQIEPPNKQVILASALPKGDRLSSMLDMACQLGMTQFQPLVFEHSVSKWSDKLQMRCERIVIEACKQCKVARVPVIKPVCSYQDVLLANDKDQVLTLLSDQFGRPASSYLARIDDANTVRVLIGPEGGLSEPEIKLAQKHDVATIRLASSILRIETAAVAAVTAMNITGQINDKT